MLQPSTAGATSSDGEMESCDHGLNLLGRGMVVVVELHQRLVVEMGWCAPVTTKKDTSVTFWAE